MPYSINDYHDDLFQDINIAAEAGSQFIEDEFFRITCELIEEAGGLEEHHRVIYSHQRGSISMRVDGYGGNPADSDNVLSLIITDFEQNPETQSLNRTDMEALFKRLSTFVEQTLLSSFRANLEETHEVFGLADLLASSWKKLSSLRLLIVTNKMLSERVDGKEAGIIEGVPVDYHVWDLRRLFRNSTRGQEREELIVDLENEFGCTWQALPVNISGDDYESFLLAVNAEILAKIYRRWTSRLLESNVRVFLQNRGKVNQGIKNTLTNTPHMFFAYNNGLSATADSIDSENHNGLIRIKSIKNFQIVNGGQTTASLHNAIKDPEIDLTGVFVQMKLSIIKNTDQAEIIIPNISRWANTQNQVRADDFFSNHPFHTRIEEFSRRIFTPSADGSFKQTKWFYERVRGQYIDQRAGLTEAEKRRFESEYPRHQRYTKTDLSLYLNLWRLIPHDVSKGAQYSFGQFAKFIEEEWTKNNLQFNESYYRELVAKAIIFIETEKLVTKQPWYTAGSGYRRQVVNYAIAKVAHYLSEAKVSLDFEQVWQNQSVPQSLYDSLVISSGIAQQKLTQIPAGATQNVTEWAKSPTLWNRVKDSEIQLPEELSALFVSTEDKAQKRKEGVKDQKVLNGIEAQTIVVNAASPFWEEVQTWGKERGFISPEDDQLLSILISIPTKIPTEYQSQRAIELSKRLVEKGCPLELNK